MGDISNHWVYLAPAWLPAGLGCCALVNSWLVSLYPEAPGWYRRTWLGQLFSIHTGDSFKSWNAFRSGNLYWEDPTYITLHIPLFGRSNFAERTLFPLTAWGPRSVKENGKSHCYKQYNKKSLIFSEVIQFFFDITTQD